MSAASFHLHYRNMSKSIGPLFKWFGSKWLSAKKFPEPIHARINEPYGGGAGYSLRHVEKYVLICEDDPHCRCFGRG
jgi:hypothetical protein